MNTAPLLGPYAPGEPVAWRQGLPIAGPRFARHVLALAARLPDRPTVLNLADDRYWFWVGLAAALIKGQTSLLPPSRKTYALAQIAQGYPDSYCLVDQPDTIDELPSVSIPPGPDDANDPVDPTATLPAIPIDQIAVIAFTSGSTGQPRPHPKTWGSMVEIARQTGARLGLQAPHQATVVATVPHWHMYGLEASIMLPLQYGMAICAERPLFAEDVRAGLERVPKPRILVTTPLHLRACVSGSAMPPEIDLVLSATAPLALEQAQQAETTLKTQLFEIYGFTEVGSLAMRRSAVSEVWRVLEGAELFEEDGRCMVRASYLAHTVPIPDRVLRHSPWELSLLGREEDLVNIAGRRTSLGELNHRLNQIEGVKDGVFFLPEEQAATTSRLIAFFVAPDRSVEQVLASLKTMVDPLFVPRPLYRVNRLPRNETGKLTQEALSQLAERCRREDGANALGRACAKPE